MSWEIALGAAITLLVASLTEWNARRRERDQREHEDRTRFQEHRLEAYTSFIHAADIVVSSAEAPAAVREAALPKIIEALDRMNEMYQRVKLCASDPVLIKAKLVHTSAARFTSLNGGAPAHLVNAHLRICEELEQTIRVELGVGKIKLQYSDSEARGMCDLVEDALRSQAKRSSNEQSG